MGKKQTPPIKNQTVEKATMPPVPKKKRKGLIITIIVVVLALLGGGGTFAALAIIKNTPENIFFDSFSHLMSSDQVAINGNFSITPKNLDDVGISSIDLDFNTELAESNQQTKASLQINITDESTSKVINFDEVKLQNGVFYLRVEDFNEQYQQTLRPLITSYIEDFFESYYIHDIYEMCFNNKSYTYGDCVADATGSHSYNHRFNNAIKQQSAKLISKVDQIAAKLDNQWIEFSLEDILNSEFFTKNIPLPSSSKQNIISSYTCSVEKINQISNYSSEFSDLYNQNQFVKLTSGQDGYYDVSLDTNHLANYINGLFNLNIYQDYAKCLGTTLPTDTISVTAEDIEKNLDYLPSIALRFDGFFDHHLTSIKVNQSNDYYDLSLNANLTYPTNLQITAPTDSRPVMDFIQELYNTLLTAFED